MYGFEVDNILSVVKVAVLKSLLLDKNFRGEAYKFRKKLKEQPTALCSTAHSIQLYDVVLIVVEDFKFHVFMCSFFAKYKGILQCHYLFHLMSMYVVELTSVLLEWAFKF